LKSHPFSLCLNPAANIPTPHIATALALADKPPVAHWETGSPAEYPPVLAPIPPADNVVRQSREAITHRMIQVKNVTRTFPPPIASGSTIRALAGVSLEIARGETVALMGASGSGKSTLLHLLGGLDLPTSGDIVVDGQTLNRLDDTALSRFRRERLGFVFQFFHLIPSLTVLENVLLPVRLSGKSEADFLPRANELLVATGLSERGDAPPDALSGGQQQRVALVRALLMKPAVLLADEPTGNLDSVNCAAVLELMAALVRESNTTLVMATHSADAAAICKRIVVLKDGLIVS
jgi:putative ABC transport system ATP-binding protein